MFFFFIFFQHNVSAQVPINDNCADAILLTTGSVVSGSTTNATITAQNAYCSSISSRSVWYKITGTGNPIIISTCSSGTNYDSYLDLYTGTCSTLLPIACNDDFCSSGRAQITFSSQLGVDYLIKLHGFTDRYGNFTLSISAGNVAQNFQTGNVYTSVQDAINAATSTQTIGLLSDVTENLLITSNVDIDANNKKLTIAPGNLSIKAGGVFKWTNGILEISAASKIINGGVLWNNGTINYLNTQPFINASLYKGSGFFQGSFVNQGFVQPGN